MLVHCRAEGSAAMSSKYAVGISASGEVVGGRVVDRFDGDSVAVMPAPPADDSGRKMQAVEVKPLPPSRSYDAAKAERLMRELDRMEAAREREATRWDRHRKFY